MFFFVESDNSFCVGMRQLQEAEIFFYAVVVQGPNHRGYRKSVPDMFVDHYAHLKFFEVSVVLFNMIGV